MHYKWMIANCNLDMNANRKLTRAKNLKNGAK